MKPTNLNLGNLHIHDQQNANVPGNGNFMRDTGPPLKLKLNSIFDDYMISGVTLGLGINGKVVECVSKHSGAKYALKVLKDSPKAKREVELHWRASKCKNIVSIIDVYQNRYQGQPSLLIVMEW